MPTASATSRCPRSRSSSAQDLPGHVLHHDEVLVVALVEAEVEHLDDVGVDQASGGQRLAPKARDESGVVGEVLGEQLDGDVALQPVVEGEVDGRHAADAEAAFDPVPAGDRRRGGHWPFPPLPFPLPPVPVPPKPAPPLPPPVVVELVLGGGGFVSVVLELVLELLVVLELVGLVVVVVVVTVSVVVGVELLDDELVVAVWQSLAASRAHRGRALTQVLHQRGADLGRQVGHLVGERLRRAGRLRAPARRRPPRRRSPAERQGCWPDRLTAGRCRRRRRRRRRPRSRGWRPGMLVSRCPSGA